MALTHCLFLQRPTICISLTRCPGPLHPQAPAPHSCGLVFQARVAAPWRFGCISTRLLFISPFVSEASTWSGCAVFALPSGLNATHAVVRQCVQFTFFAIRPHTESECLEVGQVYRLQQSAIIIQSRKSIPYTTEVLLLGGNVLRLSGFWGDLNTIRFESPLQMNTDKVSLFHSHLCHPETVIVVVMTLKYAV